MVKKKRRRSRGWERGKRMERGGGEGRSKEFESQWVSERVRVD